MKTKKYNGQELIADGGLIDFGEDLLVERPFDSIQETQEIVVPNSSSLINIVSVDDLHAYSGNYNGSCNTQDDWISYWNNITDGRVMASMPDYYQHFKQLKIIVENGSFFKKTNAQRVAQRVIDNFRKDINFSWIFSSTRLQYGINPFNNLEGKIIHHYNCNNTALIKKYSINIPIYRGTKIADIVSSTEGLKYLQSYFGTFDDAKTIVKTIEFITGKSKSCFKLWTPDAFERKTFTEMVASLTYDGGYIKLDRAVLINEGRSRGVRYSLS